LISKSAPDNQESEDGGWVEDPEGVDEVAQPLGEKSRNETFTIQKGISGRGGSGRYKTNRPDSYQHYSVCVFCLPLYSSSSGSPKWKQ
jgi:hypothetical protein